MDNLTTPEIVLDSDSESMFQCCAHYSNNEEGDLCYKNIQFTIRDCLFMKNQQYFFMGIASLYFILMISSSFNILRILFKVPKHQQRKLLLMNLAIMISSFRS